MLHAKKPRALAGMYRKCPYPFMSHFDGPIHFFGFCNEIHDVPILWLNANLVPSRIESNPNNIARKLLKVR